MARVQVLRETTLEPVASGEWCLWFQWCRYLYDDGNNQHGYRFIWRRPQAEGGSLQAARGQARIPSISLLEQLVARAKEQGWGNFDGEMDTSEVENAADRLRRAGLIVDVANRFVGWPTKEAAAEGSLSPQMLQDVELIQTRIIRDHVGNATIGVPRLRQGEPLPVAGNLIP